MAASKQTAISRNKPSAPMKYLSDNNLLKGKMLDYGCGKGFDADHFVMSKYDPNWHPDKNSLNQKYDTVTCNYVLNVIECPVERAEVLNKIKSLLAEGGTGYVTVRADVKKDGKTTKGYQANVELDLPKVKSTAGYRIYKIER